MFVDAQSTMALALNHRKLLGVTRAFTCPNQGGNLNADDVDLNRARPGLQNGKNLRAIRSSLRARR